MSSAKLREQVEAYFRGLNYQSSRVMTDLSLVRAQHPGDWDRLPEESRGRIVWEKLVRPQVGDKYDSCSRQCAEVRVFPVIGLKTGEKVVTDEDATNNAHSKKLGSWRDEHSAPFSWETQSQLNVRISQSVDEVDCPESKAEPPIEPKIDPPKAAESSVAESRVAGPKAAETKAADVPKIAPEHKVVDARPAEARVANADVTKVAEPRALECRLPQTSKSQESMSSVASRGSSNPPTPSERKGGRRRAPTPPKAPPPDPPRPKMAPPHPPAAAVAVPAPAVVAAQKTLPEVPKKHPSSKPPAPPVPKVKVQVAEAPQPTDRGAVAKPPPQKPAPKADEKPAAVAPARERPNTVHSSEVAGIPKTGFDFLDNW